MSTDVYRIYVFIKGIEDITQKKNNKIPLKRKVVFLPRFRIWTTMKLEAVCQQYITTYARTPSRARRHGGLPRGPGPGRYRHNRSADSGDNLRAPLEGPY